MKQSTGYEVEGPPLKTGVLKVRAVPEGVGLKVTGAHHGSANKPAADEEETQRTSCRATPRVNTKSPGECCYDRERTEGFPRSVRLFFSKHGLKSPDPHDDPYVDQILLRAATRHAHHVQRGQARFVDGHDHPLGRQRHGAPQPQRRLLVEVLSSASAIHSRAAGAFVPHATENPRHAKESQ